MNNKKLKLFVNDEFICDISETSLECVDVEKTTQGFKEYYENKTHTDMNELLFLHVTSGNLPGQIAKLQSEGALIQGVLIKERLSNIIYEVSYTLIESNPDNETPQL